MQLYVSGNSPESLRAIENLTRLCQEALPGSYTVPIVNVLDDPAAAQAERIMRTPTLVKTFPRPERRVVGDLSDRESVLEALDLPRELVRDKEQVVVELGRLAYDRHAGLLLGSPDGIVVLDAEGKVVFANHAAKHLLGWPEPDPSGRQWGIPRLENATTSVRLPLGQDRFAEARAGVVEWSGRLCQLVCLRDVTPYVAAENRASSQIAELLEANDKLDRDANIDPLTRVLNRRGLQHALNEEVSRRKRSCDAIAALMIDCDDFKGINDALGHAAGDLVLRALAETTAATLRPQDHIGRIGGDEFLVLLPSTQLSAAVQVAERILTELSKREPPAGLRDRLVTVSIGAALVPPAVDILDEVIEAASAPLQLAKGHGKHRVVIAQGGVAMAPPQSTMESDTERVILDPASLRVVRQGIVDIASGEPEGWEFLVRGPKGRWEMPQALFDAARNLGLQDILDRHCFQASLLAAHGLSGQRHHINVLPSTLLHRCGEELLRALEGRPRNAQLCLELNEEEILGDPGLLMTARLALRRLGVLFALDNVGFGRAALESLILLQPDMIKLRMGLVDHVASSAGRARDLQRLVAAAHSLGIQVIAQGVESQADAAALRNMGVTRGQGFLWGAPVDVACQASP